jgi:hypothetical protein
MMKHWLAGATALAMMTGAAFAQGMSSDTTISTQSTTSTPVPLTGSYSSSKTQKSTDSNGAETEKNQTFTSGSGGSNASSSMRTTTPDGSQMNTYHEERAVSPPADTTTTSHSSTTTYGR